jgi:hypothetical protein
MVKCPLVLLRRRTRECNEVMNVFAHVRGFSISDLMISTAAVAVGCAVIRAFSDLHLAVLVLAIPLAVLASLSVIAVVSRVSGRRAAWELRLPRLASALWLGVLLADEAVVLGCLVRAAL